MKIALYLSGCPEFRVASFMEVIEVLGVIEAVEPDLSA
jgi:hypothetical protein